MPHEPHGQQRGAALGLRARLLLVLAPVLVVLFLFDSWNDTRTLGQELEKAYDQSLIEPVQALVDRVAWDEQGRVEVSDVAHIRSMLESVGSANQYLRVELRSPDGQTRRVLLGPEAFPEPPLPAGGSVWQAADGAEVFYNASYHQLSLRVAAQLHESLDREGRPWRLLVQAARGTRSIDAAKRELLWQTLWRDARTLLALVAVIWLGIAWGLRPLRALRRTVQERAPHDLQPLAAHLAPGEVAPLVEALNQHLAQQRQALEEQRRFLADASHQLRTPLAILHTQAGYALREPDSAEVRRTLQGMLQQLQHSRRVCEQLLALAQVQQAGTAASPRCDANAVARAVVLQHLPLARGRHIDLGWCDARGSDADNDDDGETTAVAPVQAAPEALHEAIANLVHNAIVYTPAQGRVNVSVKLLEGWCEVWVQDSGPGIAPADRERAFARFERLAGRRGAEASVVPGSGLGLAIAQALVQRMGGQIALHDGEGGVGLAACVRLPLAT
ncbi:sensor histidine kinase [Comamonas humi]